MQPDSPGKDPAQRLQDIDAVFRALDHAARRHILLVVWFRGGTMTAGEIAGRFECTWPTTSRHIRVLVEAGLLTARRVGKTRVYTVDKERLGIATEWLAWFRGEGTGNVGDSNEQQ